MQSETADFVAGAATWQSRPKNVFWRPTDAAIGWTGQNIRVVFHSGLFNPLYETENLAKFSRVVFEICERTEKQASKQTSRHADLITGKVTIYSVFHKGQDMALFLVNTPETVGL